MSARKFSFLMMIFSAIGFMVGTGILVTDSPLNALCQKGCWLNYFLYGLLGDHKGKVVLAVIWYFSAGLSMVFALKIRGQKGSGSK